MVSYIPRLYVPDSLGDGSKVCLSSAQNHYVLNVLRGRTHDLVRLFNRSSGEWQGYISEITKKHCTIILTECVRAGEALESSFSLLCPPLKQGRFDYVVEKATELGVTDIYPLLTDHTSVPRINLERLQIHAQEAAEQCERLSVPTVHPLILLTATLQTWPQDQIIFCALERQQTFSLQEAVQKISAKTAKAALVGPEGGFSAAEQKMLGKTPFVQCVSLGPNILRTDTAAIVLLGCLQVKTVA